MASSYFLCCSDRAPEAVHRPSERVLHYSDQLCQQGASIPHCNQSYRHILLVLVYVDVAYEQNTQRSGTGLGLSLVALADMAKRKS